MTVQNQRPKILFLVHRVPYPPNRGDRIRSFHLLELLASHADVHLGYLTDEPSPQETVDVLQSRCVEVEAVQLGRKSRWSSAARSLATGRTATEGLFRSKRLRRTVDRWARDVRFDAVVVFCSSMAQYTNTPHLAEVPVFVDLVDVDSQKWFDYAEKARGWKQFLFRLEGRRLRRLESSLSDRAEALTVVSEQEAALYRDFCPTDRIHGIGNGVNLEYFCRRENPSDGTSPRCVFVGALDYRANIDGVRWFVEHVWPGVRQKCPEAEFSIVGSNPSPVVRKLESVAGVTVVGEVPDIRPYQWDARVVVAPLRVARGVQNKVLEALAMGKPVVGSPQAFEGLEVTPKVHVCRAVTPDQWVETILRLFDDDPLCEELGQAGRTLVEREYSWDARLVPFARLLGFPTASASIRPAPSGTDSGDRHPVGNND